MEHCEKALEYGYEVHPELLEEVGVSEIVWDMRDEKQKRETDLIRFLTWGK